MKRKLMYILAALRIITIIFIAVDASSFSQTPTQVFVKHIVIDADYDPRFIWSITNSAIPWDGLTSPADIECLKDGLRKTGLFSKIETQLNRPGNSDTYELVVSLTFELSPPRYQVGAIDVTELQGVNVSRLQQFINDGGFIGSTLSLKTSDYATFENRLRELVRKSSLQDERPAPIFRLRVDDAKKLRITVFSRPNTCRQ